MTIALAALCLAGCTGKSAAPKALVLYYSLTGTTQSVAEEIQAQLGADIEAIELLDPYPTEYAAAIARCGQEMAAGIAPDVKPIKSDLSQYDVIFLGYPVWYGTYAQAIAGLLKEQNFADKTVVTFCTFGSGGLQVSSSNLQGALPRAKVIEGYGVREARVASAAEEINRFLIEGGYKEGEVEALPAFMEHHPVSEEEAEVFEQACSSYTFPLGTPVDVAVRESSSSTDYEYTAMNNGAQVTIYVTRSKKEGAVPEFTQVVR